MRKLTKQQRKEKRKRKEIERRKRRKPKTTLKPWVAPKMKLFTMPRLLPDDFPREKRLELLRTIGGKAKEEFAKKYPEIEKWFLEYDAVYLLSFCAIYFLSHPEGIDPEAEGKLDFYFHYLEIMQAFSLMQKRSLTSKPLQNDAERLQKEMREIGEVMSLRLLDLPPELTAEKDINAYYLRTQMMQQTTAVRNWAYFHQVRKIVLTLANAIAEEFLAVYEINPASLMDLIFKLAEERSVLLNSHRDRMRPWLRANDSKEIIRAYNAAFPENVQIQDKDVDFLWERAGRKKRNLVGMLIAHADLRLEDILSFTVDHAQALLATKVSTAALERVFDKLSYRFGDLATFNKDYAV